jgi:CHAT domain-containing protein
MYSHVVLASGEGHEDGLLEAWEMMNLDLKEEVVVLSGCQTAQGPVSQGEGLIGMSWALFVAGVPTTVASLWKVDSASTTRLMLDFHRGLRQHFAEPAGGGTKAEALRQAMLRSLHDPETRHPFYWAGFVMLGHGF